MKRSRTSDLKDNKPSASSEWITLSRAHVKQLKKVGFSALDIQKETEVSRSTQYTWLNASVRRSDADCSERSTKLNQDTVKKMIKSMKEHYNKRIWKWQNCVDEFELNCEADTVKNHFNQTEYYKCRCCQKSWISQN